MGDLIRLCEKNILMFHNCKILLTQYILEFICLFVLCYNFKKSKYLVTFYEVATDKWI